MAQGLRALALANVRYWVSVAPHVRRELRHWERRAAAIADPALRAHALGKLRDEHFNAEVAATLATLAPRRQRQLVVTAIVAFQIVYDYLDAVSEQPVADPLANGRQLYGAFMATLGTQADGADHYRYHPQRDDGGYLDALVTACREAFWALPAAIAVAPVARRSATRCGEAQTRTHAVPREGVGQLSAWATREALDHEMTWWESAAGAAASVLSVHALMAAAADPRTTSSEAASIDAAYLPISALTTLLDSLIDREQDTTTGNHGYVAYYPSATVAAHRIGEVAHRATSAAARLRHGPHHAMTVAGAAAYYLSAPGAGTPFARPVAAHVAGELRPLVTPILGIFRLWRLAKRLRPGRDREAIRPRGAAAASSG
ncbi:MAG: DUF2600 family protein [Conexibacter sp.]